VRGPAVRIARRRRAFPERCWQGKGSSEPEHSRRSFTGRERARSPRRRHPGPDADHTRGRRDGPVRHPRRAPRCSCGTRPASSLRCDGGCPRPMPAAAPSDLRTRRARDGSGSRRSGGRGDIHGGRARLRVRPRRRPQAPATSSRCGERLGAWGRPPGGFPRPASPVPSVGGVPQVATRDLGHAGVRRANHGKAAGRPLTMRNGSRHGDAATRRAGLGTDHNGSHRQGERE